MSASTEELHRAFLGPFGVDVTSHSAIGQKPLDVDLTPPRPPRLRVYLYNLVGGAGTIRPTEYKAVLRVPKQPVGQYGAFDFAGGRMVIVAGYRADLDVFVLWDASMHHRFKNGGNIQVRDTTVLGAAATGNATQVRRLSGGRSEIVIACQSATLIEGVDDRIAATGGATEAEWAACPS